METKDIKRIMFVFSMVVLGSYVLAAVVNNCIVFADGSGICISMLSSKELQCYDSMRKFGLAIRQIFAWLYLCISSNPSQIVVIKLLSFGYSFWTSFFYGLALCNCYFGKDKQIHNILFYFIIVQFSFHYIFVGFNLVLEAGLATAIFWFLLTVYFTYEKGKMNLIKKVMMILILFLASRVYGSFMFFGILCIAILTFQYGIKAIWKDKFLLVNLLLLLYDVITCAKFVLFTENTDARDGLINTLKYIPKSFYMFFVVFAILGLIHLYNVNGTMIFWRQRNRQRSGFEKTDKDCWKHVERYGYMIYAIVFTVTVFIFAQKYASGNFGSRSLLFIIPICLCVMLMYIHWGNFEIKLQIVNMQIYGFLLSTLFAIIISTTGYSGYLKSLALITSNQKGFIDCDSYEVQNTGYMTTWILPQESILSQTIYRNGPVAISSILVEPTEWITWEPFDSHNLYTYPDLSEYQIYYVVDDFE